MLLSYIVIYKVEVIGSALFRSTGHHIMPLYFILLDVQSPFVVFFCFYFDKTKKYKSAEDNVNDTRLIS